MISPVALEIWARASPATFPPFFDLHTDNVYPLPQLHGGNFDYLRPPHLNVGLFEAHHLSAVLLTPENPSPLLDSQLSAQFIAQDRLFGVDLASPVPTLRGRSVARSTSAVRQSSARHLSANHTPGGASSNQVERLFGACAIVFLFFRFLSWSSITGHEDVRSS